MLHQIRISNNDSQLLAKWATEALNNTTLFNVQRREDLEGLRPPLLTEVGLGPAYRTRAHGQKETTHKARQVASKRNAGHMDLSPRKKIHQRTPKDKWASEPTDTPQLEGALDFSGTNSGSNKIGAVK